MMKFHRPNSQDMRTGNLQQRYLWGPAVDQILAEENVDNGADETVQWTLTDHLNTVRDIAKYDPGSDMTTVVNHLIYDAFGRVTSESNPTIDSLFVFTGKPFDSDTQLQNNLNRWYDGRVGRWLSEDPIGFAGRDGNLCRYIQNSPTGAVDPSGLRGPSAPPLPVRPGPWPVRPGVPPREPLPRPRPTPPGMPDLNWPPTYPPLNSGETPPSYTPLPPGWDEGPGPSLRPAPGTPEWEAYAKRCWEVHKRREFCAKLHDEFYKPLQILGANYRDESDCAKVARKCSAIYWEVQGRKAYLEALCDYVLPGSVKIGSEKQEANHRIELANKQRALDNCWNHYRRLGCGEPPTPTPYRDLLGRDPFAPRPLPGIPPMWW